MLVVIQNWPLPCYNRTDVRRNAKGSDKDMVQGNCAQKWGQSLSTNDNY
jgi:hypothetical protein